MTDTDGISEIVSSVLIIILVIALAAVMAALFFGVLDLTGKSAFIAPNLEMQNIGGKNVIVMENRAGDTAFLNVTGQRQYEMGAYVDTASGSVRATPVGSEDAFSPGSRLYLYDSTGGYRISGSLADISGSEVRSITACPVAVRLVDENANILIITRSLPCSGSPTPTGPAPGPVSADFKASPLSGAAPLGVQFTDLSTGPVLAWNWAFGDGNTSTARHPSYTYATGGAYAVSLTVSNGTGTSTLSRANYIAVTTPAPAPVSAAFSYSPSQGDIPLTVSFTDLSTGPVVSWYWTFGDGDTSTGQNPTHTYTVAGWKTVNLTVMNASGGSDTKVCTGSCIKATAAAPVTADFSAAPTTGSKPLTVYFTDASTGPVNWWFYDFGDGHTCNERNCPKDTKHTYTKAGKYTVSLTVRNSSGSDTITRTNYITIT